MGTVAGYQERIDGTSGTLFAGHQERIGGTSGTPQNCNWLDSIAKYQAKNGLTL
jgi:hypothetical protein